MWLAVDKGGAEAIFDICPIRWDSSWIMADFEYDSGIAVPKGTIKRLIGRELTWEDEPVEITGYDTPERTDNTFVVTQIKE